MRFKNILIPAFIVFILAVSGCATYSKGIKLIPEDRNLNESDIGEMWQILKTKAELAGLNDADFHVKHDSSGFYIEATGISKEDVEKLLAAPSIFKAMITKPVYLTNGKGYLKLGEKQWEIENGKINIDGKNTSIDEFFVDGINFKKAEETLDKIVFYADFLTSEDVEKVYTDSQHSGIIKTSTGYQFYFVLGITEKAAQRLANLTSGIELFNHGLEPDYLDSFLIITLNNENVSKLLLGSELSGKIIRQTTITGTRKTATEASNEKYRLQTTIIQNGKTLDLKIVE